jgi:hypothetical protein
MKPKSSRSTRSQTSLERFCQARPKKLPAEAEGRFCWLLHMPYIADATLDGEGSITDIHKVYHKDGTAARNLAKNTMDGIHEELNRGKFDDVPAV